MEVTKTALGELCLKTCSGGTPKSTERSFYEPATIPWLTTSEVNYSRIYSTKKGISVDGLNNSSAKLIPENSVIVAMYGQGNTAGRVAINKIPLSTNQACCNLIIDPTKADYKYVYYALCASYDKLVALKNGGAQPNLNAAKVKSFEIPTPTIEVQRAIGRILSAYDDMIDNCKRQITLLEEAAQRLYREWFVDLHFPGFETTHIGENGLPEGWSQNNIGSLCIIKTGKKDANFGGKEGLYPFFTCAQEPIRANSYSFNTHAIILAGNGDFNVKLFRGKFEAYQRTYVITSTNPHFLWLSYFAIKKNMAKLAIGASGSTIKFLTKGMIEEIICPIPSDNVLFSFNELVSTYFSQLETVKAKLNSSLYMRDLLLPRLISGPIEINA